jgi:3-hydroxyisobutyrate dehydrogenase-like beta-hydroxyacid dehydrogenase
MACPGPVGVVGVGNMGGAMAKRLIGLGWSVQVCDIDASRTAALHALGAGVQTHAADLARSCAVVIVCVVDAQQVDAVLSGEQGLLAGLLPGQVVWVCPTLAPSQTMALANRLQAQGVHVLEAPMSGGPVRALDGSMSLMLAAPDALVQSQQALLDALSNQVVRISHQVGDGARAKLVNNLLAAIHLVGVSEALLLAQRMGLDPAKAWSVMACSSGQSWIASDRMPRALAGDNQVHAHMALLGKDTALAMQAAQEVGFVGLLGPLAAATFAQACDQGWAGRDDAAMLAFLRTRLSEA